MTKGQLFKWSLAGVEQNHILSHFPAAKHFHINTICREQFHEGIGMTLFHLLKITHYKRDLVVQIFAINAV